MGVDALVSRRLSEPHGGLHGIEYGVERNFMKVLVTGSAGFIGNHFVRWILANIPDAQITSFDALTYAGNLESLKDILDHPRHKFIKGDITERSQVRETVPGYDYLFNFAAESHVDRSIDGPEAFVKTNINGVFELLEAVRQLNPSCRFIQVSTDEVYGSINEGLFTEESPIVPNSPYSSSKASADLMVRAYHHTFKLDTVITRCSNNYGPFQFPEKLIPLMIQKASQNSKLPVYGDGKNVRDWIYAEDHARGVWLAGIKGTSGEVYNFGTNNEWANIDLVKQVLKLLDKPESLIEFVKDRPGHDRRYAIDSSKAQSELGWAPLTSFEDGLEKTVDWYLENQQWLESVQSGNYQQFYKRWYEQRL